MQFGERLDLGPFCSSICQDLPQMRCSQRRVLYFLSSAIEHSGRLKSGHFTAYVRVRRSNQRLSVNPDFLASLVTDVRSPSPHQPNLHPDPDQPEPEPEPETGRWFHVSDTNVSEVTLDRVLKSQAYMLFYEWIP